MAASSPATPSSSAPAGARTCPAVIRRRCTTRSLSGSRRCPTTRCSSPATTMAGHPPPSATRSDRTRSCGSPRSATSSGPRAAAPASSSRRRRVISGRDVATLLTRHGFDFFTGVPCSLVEDVIAVLETERDGSYVAAVREAAIPRRRIPRTVDSTSDELVPSISRLAAITAARKPIGAEPIVHANGYICRESFSVGDRPQNFYMIGSMGLASAIGLGLTLARPERVAVVFDGDGNLLMNFGILAMVGGLAPRRLVHVVFDNEVYGSTGNQVSPSRGVRLDRVAAAAGYRTVAAVTAAAQTEAAVRAALGADGPHFVLVKTTAEEADVPRIPYSPAEIRDRFRASLEV